MHRINHFTKYLAFIGGLILLSACQSQHSPRIRLDMNTDWAFYRGDLSHGEDPAVSDTAWMPIALPHIMQLEKKHCGGNTIYDGVGWYRRYFKLPDAYRDKRISIHFEGVMNACELYLNNRKITEHRGGYVGFTADITDAVNWGGNNLLALRVSAEYDSLTPPGKPQDRLDFYYYSGIYRDVTMIVTDRLHITDELASNQVAGGGLFVTYPRVTDQEALVQVQTELLNEHPAARTGEVVTLLKDPQGQTVARHSTPFTLESGKRLTLTDTLSVTQPALWHPYTPNLYQLESQVWSDGTCVDSRTEAIGIRTIRYTRDGGFEINGQRLYLVGANRHQAFPYVGDAASNSMQERDVIDLKRGGFNAVRAAHYPQDPAFLAACDKYGLVVIECIPGWQYFNDSPVFTERLQQVAREMIRRDRNHPSVVLWETALNETHYPLEVVRSIYEIAHSEYPGDQMYTSADYFSHEETEPYYDVFYKQVGRFPKDGNVMSNYLEDQIAIKPLLTREWGDGVGEKPRVRFDEDEQEQMRQCRGRYQQLLGHGYFDWCMLDANPRMGGHFLWSYNDYNRGAEEYTMFCGVVDVNRYPKPSYYMMQSMRPRTVSQPGLYNGPMVYIASRNSSATFATSTTAIPVFSNCDAVRLYRNGRLIGEQSRQERGKLFGPIIEKGGSPYYEFDAGGYEAGELRAEGLIGDSVVVTHTVRTPGTPHHVEVFVPDHPIRPVADGSDMIPVYFVICDENGTRINTSDTEIEITVSGEGTLIGDGIRRVGINPQRVEGGVGFAFIRTTCQAGTIQVTARSNGLKEGHTTIRTEEFQGQRLPDGDHGTFGGHEEDGVVVKPTRWDSYILSKPQIPIASVEVTSSQTDYPKSNITDGDDFSWWIASSDAFPQTITLTLDKPTRVVACRIRFQKDSSSYRHRIEGSTDGEHWEELYDRECTGWDFKPLSIGKELRYLRITIDSATEGHAGLAEVTLYAD
ncbi:glycoside hydrolase family 2 TIM barrel-domain containing protein [Millionella massiliensis]|uniref:glycoside hydrolase family 2 TIM barrel-domain containing protein n=1 Tax=Millionella massiliensis TaxID=1871023 RepID=UPI0008DAB8E7